MLHEEAKKVDINANHGLDQDPSLPLAKEAEKMRRVRTMEHVVGFMHKELDETAVEAN